jgi:acyl-CoA synthetase (AMP-forming)/AMP-acid ligase II
MPPAARLPPRHWWTVAAASITPPWRMRVEQAAGALLEAGVKRGDRVAVYLDKRVENVAAMFGAALAGAVFVPVNPLLKARAGGATSWPTATCKVLVTSPSAWTCSAPCWPLPGPASCS